MRHTCIRESLMYIIKSKEYPQKLRNIPDPPFGIYYKGSLPDSAYPAVAMIEPEDIATMAGVWQNYLPEDLDRLALP